MLVNYVNIWNIYQRIRKIRSKPPKRHLLELSNFECKFLFYFLYLALKNLIEFELKFAFLYVYCCKAVRNIWKIIFSVFRISGVNNTLFIMNYICIFFCIMLKNPIFKNIQKWFVITDIVIFDITYLAFFLVLHNKEFCNAGWQLFINL